jgi:hypothetical protein
MTSMSAAIKSIWTRLALPDLSATMAALGPDQCKEAGLSHDARR